MKKKFRTAIPAALFSFTMLYASMPVSSFIIIPDSLNKSIYSQRESGFIMSSSDEEFTLPRTSNQKILSETQTKSEKRITVSTGDYSIAEQGDNAVYLKNTPYLNLDSREIKETALLFKNSREPVKDISLFVYDFIKNKKEGLNIVSASSIIQNPTGDCKHHSILTVALLRANRIPARAVMGIILAGNFSGKRDVFVYHMWSEAYTNGKWVLVDSTRPRSIKHNRYIAFAYHNLKTEAPLEYLNAISSINNVKIRQVE